MQGCIIVNEFLISSKFNEIYRWLCEAFEKIGHRLDMYTNAEIIDLKFNKKPDFILFWDKDILLARQLEGMGIRLFNSSEAIELCDNKALTYLALKGRVDMPRTVISPMTYRNVGYTSTDFIDKTGLNYPMVIKECCGSFGKQVYLAHNRKEACDIVKSTREQLIFQEFISESSGRDIRINTVGGKAVAAMIRYNENDFRANITNGGAMKPYTPTAEEINMAENVSRYLNLDFGGIDILFGNDKPLLCEVNSNAHFKNIYDCTGINAADYIAEYVIKCME